MQPKNIFANIRAELPEELHERLVETPSLAICRIVSRGHTSDWFDQQESEWVILLSGAARLEFASGGEACSLRPGDHLLLAAEQRHRVTWTDPDEDTVWLAIYFRHDVTPLQRQKKR